VVETNERLHLGGTGYTLKTDHSLRLVSGTIS